MDKSRYESTEISLNVLFWVNIFGLIAAVIVAALILFEQEELFGALMVLLGSAIAYCGLNVFLGIARDIIAIRNAVEKENI